MKELPGLFTIPVAPGVTPNARETAETVSTDDKGLKDMTFAQAGGKPKHDRRAGRGRRNACSRKIS
jgi:hypothetical protein